MSNTEKAEQTTHRVQFEVSDELYERGKRFFKSDKFKGYFGLLAFETRINYLEGRDKKLQAERLKNDVAYLQSLIDSGEIIIKEMK